MDGAEQAVIDLALRLTGAKSFDCNGSWSIAPPNWSCPVCKRSKMHIARATKKKVLQAHLHNHHDHISVYLKKRAKTIIEENNLNRDIAEQEWWFIHHKICSFLNRFEKILICQDCNSIDAKAKDMIGSVCEYFSFTPHEISYFIRTEAHRLHEVDREKLYEVYSSLGDIHEYRKKLADVLLSRSLFGGRLWGEAQTFPSIDHYKAAYAIQKNPHHYDGSLLLNLRQKSDANLRYLSMAVEKYEKKKHERATISSEERWQRKQEKKERLKKTREETKSIVDMGVYFNHGQLWKQTDLQELQRSYENGATLKELSVRFGRMEKAIKSRLRKLGSIVE